MSNHKTVHLLCGVPGSGKTWAAKQAKDYTYVPHDSYPVNEYHKHLINAAQSSSKPVLAEAPFRISVLTDLLKAQGIAVKTYYVNAPIETIKARYEARDHKPYPKQHLTNYQRYSEREWDVKGTSEEVLKILNEPKLETK